MSAQRMLPAQRGMSLVELMVGMLIGLIGVVIITHLYLTNEQYKRSTTGSGTAQVNGTIALYTIERDVRMAGYGLNHSGALGCTCDAVANPGCSPVQYYYNGTYSSPPAASPSGALPSLAFVPVVITETANAADSITLLYGNGPERMLPSKLSESMPQPSSELKVDGTEGFYEGDLVLIADSSGQCMMTQLTQIQASASHLQHNPTSDWNPVGGGSLLPKFNSGALVFNLGFPISRTYDISGGNLRVSENLTIGGAPVTLVDDIVDLQAQYGKDDGGGGGTPDDGVVDTWDSSSPTNAAGWQQVLALRIAVLSRSQNYERPDNPGDACAATTAANQPKWAGSALTFPTLQVAGVLPSCYKHRAFETIVPLRNMIWRPA